MAHHSWVHRIVSTESVPGLIAPADGDLHNLILKDFVHVTQQRFPLGPIAGVGSFGLRFHPVWMMCRHLKLEKPDDMGL